MILHAMNQSHPKESADTCVACRREDRLATVYDKLVEEAHFELSAMLRDAWGGIPKHLPRKAEPHKCDKCGDVHY